MSTYVYASEATKTLTRAIPTVDADGNVIKWDLQVEYSLNEYVSTFSANVDIEPEKAPADFTKAELFTLANVDHLDSVYDSQYQSVKLAPVDPETTTIADFDVDSLA